MPIEARAVSGLPGMGSGCAGFSSKAVIRPSSATAIMPNCEACASGTSMQATVRSACFSSCCLSIAA